MRLVFSRINRLGCLSRVRSPHECQGKFRVSLALQCSYSSGSYPGCFSSTNTVLLQFLDMFRLTSKTSFQWWMAKKVRALAHDVLHLEDHHLLSSPLNPIKNTYSISSQRDGMEFEVPNLGTDLLPFGSSTLT